MKSSSFLGKDPGHGVADFTEAANRMENAPLVFDIGKNGESCRTVPRAHAQVFGLKTGGNPHLLMRKIAGQTIIDILHEIEMR